MKITAVIVLLAIVGAVTAEFYVLFRERQQLAGQVSNLKVRLEGLISENNSLKTDIEYFSNPDNLEKELREKWNYKKPEEKLMIIPR